MRFSKLLFLSLLITFLFFSCEDDNEVFFEPEAKLIWTGEYDSNGCGFFVEIDSIIYKPENEGIIPPEYKSSEPLSIAVQYIDLLYDIEYNCADINYGDRAKAIKLTSMDLLQEIP